MKVDGDENKNSYLTRMGPQVLATASSLIERLSDEDCKKIDEMSRQVIGGIDDVRGDVAICFFGHLIDVFCRICAESLEFGEVGEVGEVGEKKIFMHALLGAISHDFMTRDERWKMR